MASGWFTSLPLVYVHSTRSKSFPNLFRFSRHSRCLAPLCFSLARHEGTAIRTWPEEKLWHFSCAYIHTSGGKALMLWEGNEQDLNDMICDGPAQMSETCTEHPRWGLHVQATKEGLDQPAPRFHSDRHLYPFVRTGARAEEGERRPRCVGGEPCELIAWGKGGNKEVTCSLRQLIWRRQKPRAF
jgi:hypothetical protein